MEEQIQDLINQTGFDWVHETTEDSVIIYEDNRVVVEDHPERILEWLEGILKGL